MAILKKTQAYATFMGFQIQEIYALLFLVDTKYKDYKKIEIEVIDDVCIKGDNKIICQIKRKMAGNGKITNASEDLWKTIFNWMSFLKEYIVSDKDELMFVVECGPEISEEDYIYKMNSVSSDKESEDLYTSLKDWYTKKYVLVDNKAYVRKYLDEIFMEENKYYIKTIFIKFSLMINKENYFEKMKNIFKNDYVYPEVLIDGMVDKTISWFKQKIVECYPISVDRDEYSEVIRRYIEQHIIGAKLVSLKSNVNEEDIKKRNLKILYFYKNYLN